MNKNKKILIIGSYESEYPRNRVILDCFRESYQVEEINLKNKRFKYLAFIFEIFKKRKENNFTFLMYPADKFAFCILISKIFYKNKIVFDAFTSIFDSFIYDRKLANKISIKALYYYVLDYLLCKLSDILIFDTDEHRDYFVKKFSIKESKKKVIFPVSVDLALYDKIEAKEDHNIFSKNKFNIFFYGYYIPLQGVQYIIKAANLLKEKKEINFVLVGSGQTKEENVSLSKLLKLNNIKFIPRIPFHDLIGYIKYSDLCLGIFGETEKATRVISNKILDYMACEKILITGRSPAMKRFFEEKKDVIFCNMADEHDLAQKILYVYNNYKDLGNIAESARKKVEINFSKENLKKIINNEF